MLPEQDRRPDIPKHLEPVDDLLQHAKVTTSNSRTKRGASILHISRPWQRLVSAAGFSCMHRVHVLAAFGTQPMKI